MSIWHRVFLSPQNTWRILNAQGLEFDFESEKYPTPLPLSGKKIAFYCFLPAALVGLVTLIVLLLECK